MLANLALTELTHKRRHQIYGAQVRLLYANANAGICVTAFVATVLSYLQWNVIPHFALLGWLAYMLAISSLRFILAQRFWQESSSDSDNRRWANIFVFETALSGLGWGVAGFLLYPKAPLTNQVILAFVLGGMILGAGSILAARPEAFLVFIIATGTPISVRFLLQGDDPHFAMGLLATVFTVATLISTWRIYLTVRSSLNLQFENEDLVTDLQNAKDDAERLNQELEVRVQVRTAELQGALAENEYLASHDALTGMPNRRLLEDRLEQALARADRTHHSVAVLELDLDNFKQVNDTFGHRSGDMVLKGVVARVKARLRATDTLARTGGDEFTIVADVADARGAQILISALERAFAVPFEVEGQVIVTGASIGAALYPQDGRTTDELRSAADKVMYVAKRAKRR